MITHFRRYCRESKVPVVTVFILLFVSSVVFAQGEDAHERHKQMMQQEKADANLADITLPEAILINQDGEEVRLTKLGDRVGDDVVMVSVSVDPLRDTPARMKNYASKLGAGDGWVWLTGQKQDITDVLEAFGAYTPNFEDHPSMILVGDGTSGKWARFLGFPAADQIIRKVDEFSADHMASHSHAANQEHQQ
jgi:cytochrome oxidase Cu insertion factor (SCO1/SenC/PrrC family)